MKIKFGSMVCKVDVAEKCSIRSAVKCSYGRDTIIYAVRRFFSISKVIKKECTDMSWHKRIANGRDKRPQDFTYVVPAVLMELPGNWICVSGNVDSVGVSINRIEILNEYPMFKKV